MPAQVQPSITTQENRGPSQQPADSTLHGQHRTHASAGTLTDAQMPRGDTANPRLAVPPSRHSMAAHGHAGLLRFKRQWPVPRPLLLSDSDNSDSLSEFESIADFHIEAAAGGGKLAHRQDAYRTATKADSAAECRSSSEARRSVVKSSEAIAAGKSSAQLRVLTSPCRQPPRTGWSAETGPGACIACPP